jgi:N-acyl-L-homoserine lactone synthetase
MRYRCFSKDDPYVALNHQQRTEFDHFDMDHQTLYVVVYQNSLRDGLQLMSAVRLRPTMAAYELEMPSYLYLTRGIQLPKAHEVYEGSRWVGQSSRTPEGMLSTAMMMSKLYRISALLGFKEIIGTISTLSENWLGKRAATTERKSELFHSERDRLDIMVSRIKVDESFSEIAHQLLASSLKNFSFDEIGLSSTDLDLAA